MQNFSSDHEIENEEEFVEVDETVHTEPKSNMKDARRKLESLLEEKRLQAEIDDYLDY